MHFAGSVVLIGLALGGCDSEPLDTRVLEVAGSHGTLEFRGAVERLDLGHELEFRPRIEATFVPDAEVNRTSVIELSRYSLTAISPEAGAQGVEVLYRDDQPIELRLTSPGETGPLPEVRLRVPKGIADEALRLDLSVSDGRILWRIAELE